MEQTIEFCSKYVRELASETKYVQVSEALDAGKPVTPEEKGHFDRHHKITNHYQGIKSRVEEFQRLNRHHLGTVFAASGERIKASMTIVETPKCNLDWALIEVPSHRIGDNEVTHFSMSVVYTTQ